VCFHHFIKIQKLLLEQPRPLEKPLCSSMPISFSSFYNQLLVIFGMPLNAVQSIAMPH
jgi:hypothetical protein